MLFGKSDMQLVIDYPVPEPDPGEVILKLEACTICSSDPKILAHGWPNRRPYGTFILPVR